MKYLTLIILIVLSIHLMGQTSHYVNPSQYRAPEHFANLSTAVAAASAGDTIYLHPGSVGGATITKELHIIGPGYAIGNNSNVYNVNISMGNAQTTSLNFNSGADYSTIEGVQVIGNISCNNVNHIAIKRNYIFRQVDFVEVDSSFITSNYFYNLLTFNIALSTNSNRNFICNNVFSVYSSGPADYSLVINSDSDAIVQHNIFRDAVSISNNTIFTNNISMLTEKDALSAGGTAVVQNNVFARNESEVADFNIVDFGDTGIFLDYPANNNGSSFDSRFQLALGSPAIGYATDGGDCGVFDGPFPYKLSGVTARPLITDFSISDVAPNNGMLQISIKANAQN